MSSTGQAPNANPNEAAPPPASSWTPTSDPGWYPTRRGKFRWWDGHRWKEAIVAGEAPSERTGEWDSTTWWIHRGHRLRKLSTVTGGCAAITFIIWAAAGNVGGGFMLALPLTLIAIGLPAPTRRLGRILGAEALLLATLYGAVNAFSIASWAGRLFYIVLPLVPFTAFLFEWTRLGRSGRPPSQPPTPLASAAVWTFGVLMVVGGFGVLAMAMLFASLHDFVSLPVRPLGQI